MKKRIALGLALALAASVGTTAFAAANPFTDVPAHHWSYNAIQQLSKAGIVEGYNDGQFKGDRTITRYEMAVIVAKAMAKEDKADAQQKAIIDKLAAEFSSELDNLGVRVTKLENKVGNIKLSADARLRYDNQAGAPGSTGNVFKDRFRLNMNADINDNTSVYARYVFMDQSAFEAPVNTTTSANRISDLAFTTKGFLDNSTAVTLGRYTLNLGPTGFLAGTTGSIEGAQTVSTFGNAALQLGYANAQYYLGNNATNGGAAAGQPIIKNIEYAEGRYTAGALTLNADYFANTTGYNVAKAYDIFGGGATLALSPDWKLVGEYYQNTADTAKAVNNNKSPKAYVARIAYKGAQAAIPGTWGGFFEYTDFQKQALPYALEGPYTKVPASFGNGDGIKSYDVNLNYTVAKNVTVEGIYQFDMKDLNNNDKTTSLGDKFTRVQVNYFF